MNASDDDVTVPEPPEPVADLARGCVRFVEAALGVSLDFEPETLPVLDHYIATRREELLAKPETMALMARAAGAYFGEVVRRRVSSFWRIASDDPGDWDLCLEPVYLAFNPLAVAYDAITHGDEAGATAHLQIDDEDREAVEARLAELPPAEEEEFYSFSLRLEVLEISADAIKARMIEAGLGDVGFSLADYE
ncbi:MAG TPA: hypothetical protein VF881_13340 [Polyangiaceae bacterium]